MADHLPKKLLDELQRLQDKLQFVIDLPKTSQLQIAGKKLMGAELYRIMDELQQHPQAFLTDITPPDMNDPKSIKTFLYAMQSGGRKARDKLNTVPSSLSPLFNQHHGAYGLAGVRPAYKGLNINQAIDRGLQIRDQTGIKPGSYNSNLWEILSDRKIHEGIGHGGSFNDKAQRLQVNPGLDFESMKSELDRVYNLNVGRSDAALDATKASGVTDLLKNIRTIGGFDPNIDISQGVVTEETARSGRNAVTKGNQIVKAKLGIDASKPLSFYQLLQHNSDLAQVKKLADAINNPLGRRMGGLLPFVGTAIGAGMPEAVAADRDKEIKENPNDPSLKVNKALDQISGNADRLTLAGMATAATGLGAIPGAAMIAAGEVTSLTTGLLSLGIDATRGFLKLRNSEQTDEERLTIAKRIKFNR